MSKLAGINEKTLISMLTQMVKIRTFEEKANELYLSAKMPGLTHMYSGQEAVAVGLCQALNNTDYITSTHRGHGHCIAKGAEFHQMFCELLGKEEGYCRGKGGSMHIADQSNGNLGANAIVGGSTGIATGAALSAKTLKNKKVSVCFFGDGALGQGILYEVMNMASLWSLPVIYACENNLYGEYTKTCEMAAGSLLKRGEAFGIESIEVDGQDVIEVYRIAKKVVAKARNGDGPTYLVLNTYRYFGHHVGDIDRRYYRSKEEEAYWIEKCDPILLLQEKLIKENILTEGEIDAIKVNINQQADESVQYAIRAPYPKTHEVTQHVFS